MSCCRFPLVSFFQFVDFGATLLATHSNLVLMFAFVQIFGPAAWGVCLHDFVCPKGFCGSTFWLKLWFCLPKRPLWDDLPIQNTILSAQKAPAGRLSRSKHDFVCQKGPCGSTVWLKFSGNEPFGDLKHSKEQSPFGVGSDTPSFWNHRFIFQKHNLLQKKKCMRPWIRSVFLTCILTS